MHSRLSWAACCRPHLHQAARRPNQLPTPAQHHLFRHDAERTQWLLLHGALSLALRAWLVNMVCHPLPAHSRLAVLEHGSSLRAADSDCVSEARLRVQGFYITDRKFFQRDFANGLYSASAYYWAACSASAPPERPGSAAVREQSVQVIISASDDHAWAAEHASRTARAVQPNSRGCLRWTRCCSMLAVAC